MHMLTDPPGHSNFTSGIEFDEFRRIMSSNSGESFEFACDNFFSASDAYFSRQIGTNDPFHHCLTWKHKFTGDSVVSLKLRELRGLSDNQTRHYVHWEEFLHYLTEHRFINISILDLNLLLPIVQGSLSKQFQLMKAGNINGSIFAKVRVSSVWRKVPFIDSPAFISYLESNGVPLIQEDSFSIPCGELSENFIQIPPTRVESEASLINGAPMMWADILGGFGLEGMLAEIRGAAIIDSTQRGIESHRGSADA